MLLTVALPVLSVVLMRGGFLWLASLLPSGAMQEASKPHSWFWIVGPLLMGALTLVIARKALKQCMDELHRWYDLNHGRKVVT